MARPIDPSKYFNGEPCVRCGGTLRYKKIGHPCVACMRERNAEKHQARRKAGVRPAPILKHAPPKPLSGSTLAEKLSAYERTEGAGLRSKRLNDLVRARFSCLLSDDDERSEPPQPITAGQAHRSQLPVGAAPRLVTLTTVEAERHAQNAVLKDAIKKIWHRLPERVTLDHVVALLPPAALDPIRPARRDFALGTIMAALGARRQQEGGRKRVYLLRRPAKAMVNGRKRVKARRAAGGRSSNPKIQPDAPAGGQAAQRASKADCEGTLQVVAKTG